MDALHRCIALGPLAMYLLVLGAINLSPRPFVTSGGRDVLALGLGLAGFAVAGPMELFMPELAAATYGGAVVWGILLALYLLGLMLIVLLLRPRLVLYNTSVEQLRPVLAEVVARLDPESRWAGESLMMPQLGVQLHIDSMTMMKNVQLVASGPQQDVRGWRRLERELTTALRRAKGTPNPYGVSLVMFGVGIAAVVTWFLARDPDGVLQAFNEMLRR